MKKNLLLIFLILIFLNITIMPCAYAQERPAMSLKDSFPIAEAALKKANINVTNHWLYSVIYAHSNKGFYWYYTYRPDAPSEYDEFFVKVYSDSSVDITGGPEPA